MDKIRKEKISQFRFGVIHPLLMVKESEKGKVELLLRDITSKDWEIPFSKRMRICRSTVLDWLKRYRESGELIESLMPRGRSDAGKSRVLTSEEELAIVTLKKNMPLSSANTVIRIAKERNVIPKDFRISGASFYRILKKHSDTLRPKPAEEMLRFEVELPNDLWQSDSMHGPYVKTAGGTGKTYLIAAIDDHSRLIVHAEFYLQENIDNLRDCLKKAIARRGLPRKIFTDNGPSFRCHLMKQIMASLGIAYLHARPYKPSSKGKVERWFQTIRTMFLPLVPPTPTLAELNIRLADWIDREYHTRKHGSTSESPLERYARNMHLVRSAPENLEKYFRFRETRKVSKDRIITVDGKLLEAPAELVQCEVEILFEKDNFTEAEIFYNDKSYGMAKLLDKYSNSKIRRQKTNLKPEPAHPEQTAENLEGALFGRKEEDCDF